MTDQPSVAQQAIGSIAPKLAQLTDEVLFGDIWERPGLSKRDRSLITVTALVALYRTEQMAFHLQRALDNGVTKAVLRRAVGDLLPPPVRDRVDKLGFVTPTRRFFRGAFGEYAAQLLASPQFAAREFVDVAEAQGRLAALRAGQPVSEAPVWRALNLELWARAFLD